MARFKVTYTPDPSYWDGDSKPIVLETDDVVEALADLLDRLSGGYKVSFKAKAASVEVLS